jgi:glycosyltransferase involved in cell wall biosynthesis
MSRLTRTRAARRWPHGRGRATGEPLPRSVAIAVPDFDPSVGGTSRQVGLQARALRQRGYDVTVFTRRRRRDLPRSESIDGLAVRRLGPRGHGRFAEKLAALELAVELRRRRQSVAVLETVQWTDAVLAATWAGLADRTAVVWAARGDAADAVRPDRRLGRLRRRCLMRSHQVVLTEEMAAELRELRLPAPTVIPVAVDRTHFRPPSPEERESARAGFALGDELAVLYVGHLRSLKRVDALVDAFASLVRQTPARLLLVGGSRGADDDVEPRLRDQVERLGIAATVDFAGVVADPRPAYWAADVFVLPSNREGMPNTLLEALACGVACVAPPSAGGDAVLANGAGMVPPTNDPADLLVALSALARDPGLRAELARTGVGSIAPFDVEAVTDTYERLFEEIGAR